MAYASRNKDVDSRYHFPSDNPTVSKLVKPDEDSYTIDRKNIDNSNSTRRPNDDRYTTDFRRTGDRNYEGTRRSSDDRNPVRIAGVQENDRRIPTADVYLDPTRRPSHGNARTCCMEINIAVSLGTDRTPQASIISSNITPQPPNIRSTASIEGVRYFDLDFQTPSNTAQLRTDGIIHLPPLQKSTTFPNEHTTE